MEAGILPKLLATCGYLAAGVDTEAALRLHDKAHHLCFIANSVNFPVLCEPSIKNRVVTLCELALLRDHLKRGDKIRSRNTQSPQSKPSKGTQCQNI